MSQGRLLLALTIAATALLLAPAANAKIFWANGNTHDGGFTQFGSIGSANTDGTRVKALVLAQNDPCAVATGGKRIYWASRTAESIGRANLDGGNANPSLITGIEFHCGQIAVDSQHIYWTQGATPPTPSAGRTSTARASTTTGCLRRE